MLAWRSTISPWTWRSTSRTSVRSSLADSHARIQDSSYPMDIAQQAGLLVPHDLPRGTVRAMAEHGHVEVGYRDEITTRMPTPDEAQTLDLAVGVPVLAYVRTCYTKERPVRLTETIFAGDRNRLVYELGDLDALYERDE